jgi:hypothetical protein
MRYSLALICCIIQLTSTAQSKEYEIIGKADAIPGDIDTGQIQKLDEPLRAMAALYSAMGGTNCDGEKCQLTTALGLGDQGSEAHINLIKKYFHDDKVAKAVINQHCYLRPSGASTFTEYEYLTLRQTADTVVVTYTRAAYDHGKMSYIKGPDIYLYSHGNFKMIKRKLWSWYDK